MGILTSVVNTASDEAARDAGHRLATLLDPSRICGDLINIDYSSALVLVHDRLRSNVGGVPKGCFLVASRLAPGATPNAMLEDTSLILLRVLDKAPLPNSSETDRMRYEAGQRVSASDNINWDDEQTLDKFTANFLRFAGVECRVIGTFMMRMSQKGEWAVQFGADLSNIYSGRGMKVYKPDGELLKLIANFVRPLPKADKHPLADRRIKIGRVRYAASERQGDTTDLVDVTLDPTDLIARRTALFGMSRTGKSNTVKKIASSVFMLRADDAVRGRVGQLILDANGEYANDNPMDKGALRSVFNGCANSGPADVVTYGLHPHPRDLHRQLVKLNFFGTEPKNWFDRDAVVAAMTPMIQAKAVVDAALASQGSAQYKTAFMNVDLSVPDDWDPKDVTRYRRIVTAYRTILAKAGLARSASMQKVSVDRLTNEKLRTALGSSETYARAAVIFGKDLVSWDEAYEAFNLLRQAIGDKDSPYVEYNRDSRKDHEEKDWHDSGLMGILALMEHQGGIRLIGKVSSQHSPDTTQDFADQIVADLSAGKLVIVDQSTGDPELNEAASRRLMWRVFDHQKAAFTNPRLDDKEEMILPPDIVVYVEEAHNLLPKDGDDLKDIWPRVAKEGSKYRIGLVYATQEPSSIMSNILSNTDNWFVAHLNRAGEVKQVRDFYDFGDFEQQILNVALPGFIRMRTLSNPYVVPVQIDPFVANAPADQGRKI